jgi:peptide/nickel transport system substrate-binding protein
MGPATPAAGGQRTPVFARPAAYKEAPQLAEQVRAGRLPPLEQRLPKAPLVVPPVERVGRYGGAWRTSILGPSDALWLDRTVGYEPLVRWDPGWERVIANVAEAYERNADATEYTFRLREGLKWSDGAPVTADDILFWWEDITLNKELNPGGVPLFMRQGSKVGTIEKTDQYTIRVRFEQPNGLFLANMAQGGIGVTPKHYLQRFHQKYNTTTLDQLVRENNAESWVRLYQTKGASIPGQPYDAQWYNPELPRLHAWALAAGFGAGNRLVFERNPYYFKVDPDGNQLPYLDRVIFEVIQDREVMVLKALNGEIDMQDRNINTQQNKAVFTDNMQRGGYRFWENIPSSMNSAVISLNLTHKDPVKRQVFQNKDFRIGLSYAINRQEISDVVYVGQGEPWQAAARRETPFYSERLAKQYTEFDLTKANEHLDKAFPRKNAQGLRLGPDGRPISFVVEVFGEQSERVDTLNLIKESWKRVGVEIEVKPEDRSLFNTRKNANEHDAVVWGGDAGLKDALVNMSYYFPFGTESNYAQAWAAWYNPGGNPRTQAEEPPDVARRQMQLYDQIKATGDEARQIELMKQILELAADQFYCIGTTLPANSYGIVKNNFRNVPATMFSTGGPYLNPAPTNPSQYFIQ